MKKNILKSLFVSMLCMLAASCQDTEELAQAVDSSKAQVVFSIAMDSPIARSRANQSWGSYDPTDEGTPKDNHIDINQFVVKMEIQGTEYHLSDIIKWKAEGEKNVYQFVGIVNGINKKTDVYGAKISVFANMGKDEESLITEFPYSVENIPMWGVRKIGLNEDNEHPYLAPGTRVDLGSIGLLRAMAKMEVALTPDMAADYELKEVSLNKFNGTGYCLPKGYGAASNTQDMSTTGVFNPLDDDSQALLTFKKETYETKDGTTKTSYIVYLPEVDNKDNSLEVTVKLLPKNASDETALETGTFAVMDYTDEALPVAIDIIRNHWYQYEISGFAAGEFTLGYDVLDWGDPINIEVGGAGFLGLSADVVEVFNGNIGTLQFSSSSPITSVKLKDIYKHESNGTFTEGTTDGKNAYYITKFGQKVQLGDKPGFEIANQEDILEKETQILTYIDNNVTWDNKKEGNITIDSPYINHKTYQDSHYDTPRYLEFEVTNHQGLTATFRMIQYPPVVITNIEGYFSYREDMRIGNLPLYYYRDQFRFPFGQKEPIDNGEPTHYKNPIAPFFALAGFFKYNEIEWNNETNRVVRSLDKLYYEEGVYGYMERDYHRVDAYKNNGPSGVYHRTHYYYEDGSHFIGSDYNDASKWYQNVGPVYYKEETGKYYRRHYTGNSYNFFFSKFVGKVHGDGKATINSQIPNISGPNDPTPIWDQWASAGDFFKGQHANHRMYHIRATTSTSTSNYTIGWPMMVTEDGRTYTAEGIANSKMVSPSFMVASQLGETNVPTKRDYYDVPLAEGMYVFAKRQCEQYAEAFYEDIDGDGYTPGKDPITHYNDWRLPTKAELEIINHYQQNSRAMDQVLTMDSYFCASTNTEVYGNNTVLFDRRINPEGEIANYHMRCVRDVKPGQKILTKTYPI